MSGQADAAAAQVAAQVSLLYNAPHFLVLRIGLLGGHPIQAHELVALEAGVQKAVGRLEAQINSLKQELELESAHTHGTARTQAQLAAQLAASRANEQALQQMLDQARADAVAVKQQLRDTQLMLADSQQALAAAAGVADELRVRISHLEQKQQQADDAATAQQQHQQQQAEVAVSTPATNKAQTPLPLEQPADTAADTLRQPDQRTPQAVPGPQHLLLDATQQDQQGASQQMPVVRHVPSPLLSPSPLPDALRRSGRESPCLTPQLASRIPVAPEAAAKQLAALSYAAALTRPQAAPLEGPAATVSSSSTAAGRWPAGSSRSDTAAGPKPCDFKFAGAAPPYAPPAVGVTGSIHRPFGAIYRPFTTGTVPSSTTPSRFGSSGSGSISSRRRAIRSGHGAHSNRQAKVQPPFQRQGPDSSSSSRLPRALPEPDGHTDSSEARKRRWR